MIWDLKRIARRVSVILSQNFDPNFEHALIDLIIMSCIFQMNFQSGFIMFMKCLLLGKFLFANLKIFFQ